MVLVCIRQARTGRVLQRLEDNGRMQCSRNILILRTFLIHFLRTYTIVITIYCPPKMKLYPSYRIQPRSTNPFAAIRNEMFPRPPLCSVWRRDLLLVFLSYKDSPKCFSRLHAKHTCHGAHSTPPDIDKSLSEPPQGPGRGVHIKARTVQCGSRFFVRA